jgi:apolipoprotein N-acyltransferase
VADWGQRQHRLHARIAPLRAAEYRLPIFRVASSGISQLVGRAGEVTASAPFPGEGASITGKLELAGPGHLPWDRFLARVGVIVTLLTMLGLVANRMRETRFSREQKTFVEQKPQPVHH